MVRIAVFCGNTIVLRKVPAPVRGEVDHIMLRSQVMTGMELDPSGMVRVLDAPSWLQRRRELERRDGPALP